MFVVCRCCVDTSEFVLLCVLALSIVGNCGTLLLVMLVIMAYCCFTGLVFWMILYLCEVKFIVVIFCPHRSSSTVTLWTLDCFAVILIT